MKVSVHDSLLVLVLVLSMNVTTQAETWSGFRGDGNSHITGKTPPLSWEMRGRRARGNWTVRLPGYGQSSPVVWNDKIFVTAVSGEAKQELHVLCLESGEGSVVWQADLKGTQAVKDSDTVSRGAPTPVVDNDRVYAVFESGDAIALSHTGDVLWEKSFVKEYGEIKGPHGYSSSPVLAAGKLLLQVCHGGPSYVLALDGKTGDVVWKTEHPSQTGWSTPAVDTRDGKTMLIVSSAGSVRAFDVSDGKEVWLVTGLAGNATPTPTVVGDLVLIGGATERGGGGRRDDAAAQPPATLAIRLGGSGDVTSTHIAWRNPKLSTGYASPVVIDDLGFFINRAGVLQCVKIADGEILWQQRLPGQAWASPIAANKHVVCFCKDGAVASFPAQTEAPELVESSLSATDVVYGVASADGAWIIRTGRGLVRISGEEATGEPVR
jgi:outer membrane protein assembly factor BamB